MATLVGLFIFSFISFFIFAGIVSSLEKQDIPQVKDNSVLYMKLNGILQERVVEDPLQEIFPSSGPRMQSLMDILEVLKNAKDDDRIKGIYMEHQMLRSGLASLQEIRDALIEFKSSGKFVYSYGEYISEGDYYLASVSDTIYLNPEGSLEFNGLSANVTFWKGLFEKLEIEPEIFRVGEFKSAVEPFMRKDLSDENRLQINEFLASVYDHYLEKVAESRGIDLEQLRIMSDQFSGYLPEASLSNGLIDKLGYEDEIKDVIASAMGVDDVGDLKFISHSAYAKTIKGDYSKNRIAVIVANGDIVMGNSDDTNIISGETFAREIRKARENDRVKAIVLRINSPGGSLTASELIWREIQLTKGKKPIIASMSNLAASGGYYIATLADTIVAQPNTLTGSIGIFGLLFNMEKFLENKLGITHDVVKTGQYSDLITITRPLNSQEKGMIQKGVQKGYDTFISKVTEGRGMSKEETENIAGGRIWSGLQAKENGLVDVIGSFEDAVRLAAQAAEVEDDYSTRFYPVQKPFIEQLMGSVEQEVESRIFNNNHHLLSPLIEEIETLSRMRGIQARLPFNIEIN